MEHKPWITDPLENAAALRSQLNQMAAASQVLEHTAGTEKSLPYLAVINQSICRTLRIVGHMELGAQLSDEDAFRLSLRPKALDLSLFLEELVGRLDGILGHIGISIDLRCPPRQIVWMDSEVLFRMLTEMVAAAALVGTRITLAAALCDARITLTATAAHAGSAEGRPALPDVLQDQEEQTGIAIARRIAQLCQGSLMVLPHEDGCLTITAALPRQDPPVGQTLESPLSQWHSGGFDAALVAMSGLLPAQAFLPEFLG